MWKASNCISWLQERYEETESSEIQSRSIFQRYQQDGGTLSKNTFCKYITHVFSNARLTRKFCTSIGNEEKIYIGLSERSIESEVISENISDIKQYIPSPFFVCEENQEEIHVAMICKTTINSNPVIKKIIFKSNSTWELYIGEIKVKLNDISIDTCFTNTRACVQNICSIVYKVRLCNGKQRKNVEGMILRYHVREFLGPEKTEVYRSLNCSRILPLLNIGNACQNCIKFRRSTSVSLNVPKKVRSNTSDNINSSEKPIEVSAVQTSQQIAKGKPLPSASPTTDDSEELVLKTNNDRDMRNILEEVLPEASGEMLDMLVEQKKNLAKNPNRRRWNPKTISLCLSLWCRSKKNYAQLQDSKVLILPSNETLRIYKNSVDQKAGFNKDVMKWMAEAAEGFKGKGGDMCGGIAIDEMSIQEDLSLVKCNGEVRLVGFVDMGEEADCFAKMCSGKSERQLATHVLQFLYIGLNGFRFPFACFPVTQTKAGNLHFLFWNAVKFLNTYGFKVCFVSMDGAQTNRDFLKLFFCESSPVSENFSTKNIWSPNHPPIIFIMDYSHVLKRIRNNISKSGDTVNCKRNLHFNHPIFWEHWVNAFKWDRDTNSFPIHRKLTNDHLYLTQESKMRNKLAEDVMDSEMLNLMQAFQKALGETGDVLDDSIHLLKATSTMVSVFRDKRPITDIEDIRLENLKEALTWFDDWEKNVTSNTDVPSGKKEKMLMSQQTREDVKSCIIGFTQLCRNMQKSDRSSIVPARINSDVIENIFCQQRGILNGNNTNPTFYQYVKNINSVIIGQSVLSKTCNTGSGLFTPVSILSSRKSENTKK